MQQKKFEELFEGYLQNTLSDAEQQQMMEIMQQGEHDDFLKEKIHDMLKSDYVTDVMDKKQSDDILNYILSKPNSESKVLDLNPKRRRKVFLQSLFAAASIALLIALGNSLFFKQKATPPTITPETPAVVAQNTLIDFSDKQLVHFPDATTVLLNDNSTLK